MAMRGFCGSVRAQPGRTLLARQCVGGGSRTGALFGGGRLPGQDVMGDLGAVTSRATTLVWASAAPCGLLALDTSEVFDQDEEIPTHHFLADGATPAHLPKA